MKLDLVKGGETDGRLQGHIHSALLDASVILRVHVEALGGVLLCQPNRAPELADAQAELPLGALERLGLAHPQTLDAGAY
jgi:hypothetical protein